MRIGIARAPIDLSYYPGTDENSTVMSAIGVITGFGEKRFLSDQAWVPNTLLGFQFNKKIGIISFLVNGRKIGHIDNIPNPYDWYPIFCVFPGNELELLDTCSFLI
jgi:hypothetical protein